MPRMNGMTGTVTEARPGSPPYYAVTFDGQREPHRWLAEDEIERADAVTSQPHLPAEDYVSEAGESFSPLSSTKSE
jgi:hypothetical protein